MTLTSRQQLILFIAAAFVIDYLPFVNLPFLWSETFFHEISHGLAALLTGGMIHNITLSFNGSGVCTTSGGMRFLISFSGYAGSALWGLLIYSVAGTLSQKNAKIMVGVMVAMLGVTLLLWARDVSTIIILLILLLMYAVPLVKSLWFSVKFFIQLVGVFVMLDAIRSPLYLLDGRDLGDGASLAQLTGLPEFFWVALWFVIAVGCLYRLWVKPATVRKTVH
ncbi:MAG: M50 family metallopeptidase [Gammaproteobacteria bacterium]|nr:M50 family metallopeptidase [Gammaproteobacteria bacterium]